MASNLSTVNSYLSEGIHTVDGWCIPQLWQSIWPLYKAIGDGPVTEIGVFEGKFFLGLAKTFASENFDSTAIDVFDMQQFNLDGAGIGKKHKVLNNGEIHKVSRINTIQMDSLCLRQTDADALIATSGKSKFFSVDGCHEVLHTTNDIEFGMKVIADDGIISVDDYLNPNWPGVIEAVAKMYLLREFNFVPLLFTCNKLLLCSASYHRDYLKIVHGYVSENHKSTRMKRVKRFGYDTLTLMPKMHIWEDLV